MCVTKISIEKIPNFFNNKTWVIDKNKKPPRLVKTLLLSCLIIDGYKL